MKVKYLIVTIFLLFVGCKEPKFGKSDFVGVWKAEDGAEISLNNDGTCILKNVNKSIVTITENDDEKLTTDGTWKLIDTDNNSIAEEFDAKMGVINTKIEITYNLVDREGKGGVEFYISGQEFLENTPPWDLFVWNGDPDEMIKYKFVKQ